MAPRVGGEMRPIQGSAPLTMKYRCFSEPPDLIKEHSIRSDRDDINGDITLYFQPLEYYNH